MMTSLIRIFLVCMKKTFVFSYVVCIIQKALCTKLYRQIVGIPMGTNCAPLVADLFLFCYIYISSASP